MEVQKHGECLVENLDPSTQYTVYVEARDEAGNMTRSDNVTIETKKAVNPPRIEITPKDGTTKLQNDWYSGDVEAKITFTVEDPDNPLKLKYKVTGATNITEKTSDAEVSIDIGNEGITTITAWTEDSEGNKSKEIIEEVRIDLDPPESPVITVTGSRGEDPKWFSSNMQVTITGKRDSGSEIAKIRYEITKNGTLIENRTPNGAVVTRELKEDGTYTIRAWAIDQAGRESPEPLEDNYSMVTVYKDGNAPTNVTLSTTSIMSTRASVRATAKDNGGSGIYTYKFFIKTNNASSYTEKDTVTVDNAETCEYTYTGLSEGVSYDLMVEVRDKAGNMVRATAETFATKSWIAKVRRLCKL